MRRLGNATDENGDVGDLVGILSDPSLDPIGSSETTATVAGVFSDPSTNGPLDCAPNGVASLPPSIGDWLAAFRPFAASLTASDEDIGGKPDGVGALVKVEPTKEINAPLSDSMPFVHATKADFANAPDAVPLTKPDLDTLQKLLGHLSDLDSAPVSHHNQPLEALSEGPIVLNNPVTVPVETISDSTAQIVANGGGLQSTGGTGTASSTSSVTGGAQSAGLVINVAYDASVNNAPAAFKADVAAVVSYLESQFTDPVTINIQVGYGEVNGQTMSSAIGQSMYFVGTYNYSQVRNALAADAKTTNDQSAVATLPGIDPTNGGTFYVTAANA